MKKIFYTISILFLALFVSAQEINEENNTVNRNNDEIKTIFGHPNSVTGYCSFTTKYGEFYDLQTWDFGMRAGLIVDHWFGMGFAAYGIVQEPLYNEFLQADYSIEGGYGGIYFEPILFGKMPVHVSFPLLIGAGGCSYQVFTENENWEEESAKSNPFWIIEPGAELELNVFKHFRLAFGVHYRYTSELNFIYRENDALNGISGSMTIKVGTF